MKPQKPPQPLLVSLHRAARVVAGLQLLPVALDQPRRAVRVGPPPCLIRPTPRSEAGKMLRIGKAIRTRLLHLDVGKMVVILVKCATLKYKLGKCALASPHTECQY